MKVKETKLTKDLSKTQAPTDLEKVLASSLKAKEKWSDLTPIARRDFISWIESAKQPETRMRRIESMPSRLASGKRRPCCYALVPMSLYKALAIVPKAKATWSVLTPDERRDFVDWVNTGKESTERTVRINTVCMMLTAGKRHP